MKNLLQKYRKFLCNIGLHKWTVFNVFSIDGKQFDDDICLRDGCTMIRRSRYSMKSLGGTVNIWHSMEEYEKFREEEKKEIEKRQFKKDLENILSNWLCGIQFFRRSSEGFLCVQDDDRDRLIEMIMKISKNWQEKK